MNKRTNKYPNNRYDSKNKKRTKIITNYTPKDKSEKLNRNGFVKETIPAKNNPKNIFPNSFFSKSGRYNFLWIPFILVFLAVIIDFSLQFVVYSNLNPYYVSLAKNSLFFLSFSIILLCTSIASFVYMGLETARNNLQYKKSFKIIFKIVLVILILETIFTIFTYSFFLFPKFSFSFITSNLHTQYIYYLFFWNIIKSIIYLLLFSVSYLLFFKLKFV